MARQIAWWIGLILLAGTAFGQEAPSESQAAEPAKVLEQSAPDIKSMLSDGPHAFGVLRESDGLRNGPGYRNGLVYYPTDVEGPLASVVLVPGYLAPQRTIRRWGPFLASHGIVAMLLDPNRPMDTPPARAQALRDGIETLRAEHARKASPLAGRLDTDRFAVGGWSMGGGGAQLAALADPGIKAVLALCPWNPNARFDHEVPVLFITGEQDRTASTRVHAERHYRSMPDDTPKMIFEVGGSGHWAGTRPNNLGGEVGRVGLAWLKVFLLDDEAYRPCILKKPDKASRFEHNLETDEMDTGKSSEPRSSRRLDDIDEVGRAA